MSLWVDMDVDLADDPRFVGCSAAARCLYWSLRCEAKRRAPETGVVEGYTYTTLNARFRLESSPAGVRRMLGQLSAASLVSIVETKGILAVGLLHWTNRQLQQREKWATAKRRQRECPPDVHETSTGRPEDVRPLEQSRAEQSREDPPKPPSGEPGAVGAELQAPAPDTKPAQAELLKPPDSAAEVFAHWLRVMGRGPRAVLDDKRRRAIEKQLNLGRTVADLKRAVDGCRGDPFSMGANPERKRWDELALILRDAEHVEKFLAQATAPPVALGHDGIAVAAQARGPPARAGAHVLVHANPNEPRVPGRKEL